MRDLGPFLGMGAWFGIIHCTRLTFTRMPACMAVGFVFEFEIWLYSHIKPQMVEMYERSPFLPRPLPEACAKVGPWAFGLKHWPTMPPKWAEPHEETLTLDWNTLGFYCWLVWLFDVTLMFSAYAWPAGIEFAPSKLPGWALFGSPFNEYSLDVLFDLNVTLAWTMLCVRY